MSEREGLALIQRRRARGLGGPEYCQEHNVGLRRLRYWAKRVKSGASVTPSAPSFPVWEDEPPAGGLSEGDGSHDALEILVGEVMSIRMPACSRHLGAVLRAVQEIAK